MSSENKYIAILGGRGMLGTDVFALCQIKGLEARVLDFPEFDITDAGQVKNAIAGAAAVINCAAYTDVEKAESESEKAYKVNCEAVGMLGEIAGRAGVRVIHFGTDFVFDGTSDRPYREEDKTNPLSVYGASKLAGEKSLFESGCEACVVRIEWTYGRGGNQNFVRKIIAASQTRKELKVVDDQVGSPTPTADIAKIAVKLLEAGASGLFHYASSGHVSRYEMAKFIFEKLKMDVSVLPCKTSDYKTAAQRPLSSRFDCSKVAGIVGAIPGWQSGLERFLSEMGGN